MNKKKKSLKKLLIGILIILTIFALTTFIYINDYYSASNYVDTVIGENSLRIFEEGPYTYIEPKDTIDQKIGMVFYPGGKVEAKAYIPLLLKIADRGITTILVEMPGNLAVLDINAADDIFKSYHNIDRWYIAGHSLGGAMASQYLEKNYNKVEGLILLGSYPVNDAPVETLAIYGTYDLKLDLDKVSKADIIYEIIGGNHAYFGDYGEQDGDGESLISHSEQQTQAVDKIMDFILD